MDAMFSMTVYGMPFVKVLSLDQAPIVLKPKLLIFSTVALAQLSPLPYFFGGRPVVWAVTEAWGIITLIADVIDGLADERAATRIN